MIAMNTAESPRAMLADRADRLDGALHDFLPGVEVDDAGERPQVVALDPSRRSARSASIALGESAVFIAIIRTHFRAPFFLTV